MKTDTLQLLDFSKLPSTQFSRKMSTYYPTFPSISPLDKQSFGNNHQVVARHYYLDLTTDFKKNILVGYVDITLESLVDHPKLVVVDARNLVISQVKFLYKKHHKHHDETINEQQKQEHEIAFMMFAKEEVSHHGFPPVFGQPLAINLVHESIELKANDQFVVRVFYETTHDSEAIQWLNPEQTLGKKHPYLFTQCQVCICVN